MARRLHRASLAACTVAVALGVAACGSEPSTVEDSNASIKRGADLFVERCAGCHTFSIVGAEGGALRIHDRERVDGPSFDERREDRDSVLYAIRNGGFSGGLMPENIVVGQEAEDVAAFVAKYAGGPRRGRDITPQSQPTAGAGDGEAGGAQTTTTPGGAEATTPQAQTTTGQTQTQAQGGGGQTTTTPGGAEATTPQAQTTTGQTQTQAQGGGGQEGAQAAEAGRQVFTENCAGCHTLADAEATGSVGPNLDQSRPDRQAVQQKVLNGGGGMPAFRGRLGDEEIAAVSQYVADVAGR